MFIQFFVLKQDFVAQIITLESKQSGSATQYTRDLMSDPVIFLRKWIGEVSLSRMSFVTVYYKSERYEGEILQMLVINNVE